MKKLFLLLYGILQKGESFFYKYIRRALLKVNRNQNSRAYKIYLWLDSKRAIFISSIYNKLKPKGLVLKTIRGIKMYIDFSDRGIAPKLLTDKAIEKCETKFFLESIKEGDTLVDIGANIGYYSLIASKLIGKRGVIYAFEPEPVTYEILCKNIEINKYDNIKPIQKAVAKSSGKNRLYVDHHGRAISSFNRDNVSVFNKQTGNIKKIYASLEVNTVSLDDFFNNATGNQKIDILKIDTQGSESLVVEGADRILRDNNLKIFMEFWPHGLKNMNIKPVDLFHKLKSYGFKISIIKEPTCSLELVNDIDKFCSEFKPNQECNLFLEK